MDLASQAVDVKGAKVLAATLDGADVKTLRETMDRMKERLKSAAIVLSAVSDGKVSLIAGVTSDLVGKVKAGDLVNFVAQQVGVHESTVSRATANKFVMLPNQKVIPYADFFRPSLSTKDVIKEFIEQQEAEGKRITDREICDLLLEQGIRIARRTVAKYRSELGILPSTMR